MLEACAPYARWVDVFCEAGAFDAGQAAEVLRAGAARSLRGRVHANQLGPGPGVRVAVEAGAASADHCTFLSAADVDALSASGTVATLLPGAEFSTRSAYADGRRLLDAGVTVALASDCNPGTSYTTSIPWCIALATREMGMTVDEAVWAATLGGARALQRDDIGHLAIGARADLVVLDAPSHLYLAYRPGVPLVAGVWRGAQLAWAAEPYAFGRFKRPVGTLARLLVGELVGVIELQPKLVQLFTVKEQLLIGAHIVIVDGVVHEILFLAEVIRT